MNEKYISHLQNRELFSKGYEHVKKKDVCTFQNEAYYCAQEK